MKRFILFTIACAISIAFFSANAFAGTELRFFGVVDDGTLLHADAFSPRLAVKLTLTDRQRLEVQDILSDCHDRVVIIRRDHPRDFDRLVKLRYADADKRILTVLTPAQVRMYRRYRPDVHQWIHEQREWKAEEHHDAHVIRREERHERSHHWDPER